MNKKASKIVLFTTIGLMLACTAVLGFNIKDEDKLEDISGKREVLNNVNLICQTKVGAYRTKEIKISKDKTEIDTFEKARNLRYPSTSFYKENRDFYKDSYGLEHSYEEGNTIGYVRPEYDYYNNGNERLILKIHEKDLDTNKVDKYEVEMETKNPDGKYIANQGTPIRYNGELYILATYQDESKELLKDKDNSIIGHKEILINIYKIDLQNEVAELVDTKTFKDGDNFIDTGYSLFTHDNKFYIEMYDYEKVIDKKLKRNTSYIVYDLKDNTFKNIDMSDSLDIYLATYSDYTNEDIKDDIAKIIKYTVNEDEISLSISTLDLKSDKFIKENETYNIKAPEKDYEYHISNMRSIDEKLYIVVDGLEVPDASQGRSQFSKRYLYVIDEQTKENLYTGYINIKQQVNESMNIDIVLDTEL